MGDRVTVGEASELTGESARKITNAIYNLRLDPRKCIKRGGRVWIERSYLPELKRILNTDRRRRPTGKREEAAT